MRQRRPELKRTCATWMLGLIALLVSISAASAQAAAPGQIVGWGFNEKGALGDGSLENRAMPVAAPGTLGTVAVSSSDEHALAVLWDGSLLATGINDKGQLGDDGANRTAFAPVPGVEDAVGVSAGRYHSLVLLDDGRILSFGLNDKGQLGDGTTTPHATPTAVPGITTATQISAGENYSLAVLANGTVMAWGENGTGQLGDGSTTQRTSPVAVDLAGFAGAKVVAVSGGGNSSLALLDDGRIIAWGSRGNGKLGDGNGTSGNSPTPVAVDLSGFSSPAVAISVGSLHCLAALADGTVLAWGSRANGKIGDGGATTGNQPTPIALAGLTGVVDVSASGARSLALTAGGEAWAWGSNGVKQLGAGGTGDSTVPVQTGVTGAVAIADGARTNSGLAIVPVAASASPSPLSFGTQATGTVSAGQQVMVSAGSSPLSVKRLQTSGAAATEFLVTSDSCTGEALDPGGTCTAWVRFSPSEQGARSATLTVRTDASSNPEVSLTGSGGSLPQGPQGPLGPQGPQGPSGPEGAPGTPGPAGVAGADGLPGPTGPAGGTGLTGPAGPAGTEGPRGESGPRGSSTYLVCRYRGKGKGRKLVCRKQDPPNGRRARALLRAKRTPVGVLAGARATDAG